MLPGQMSLWLLESVQDGPRNLRLKFCQNRFSNSWDITDIEFSGGGGGGWWWWWVVVVVGGGGGGDGVQTSYRVTPTWVVIILSWSFIALGCLEVG